MWKKRTLRIHETWLQDSEGAALAATCPGVHPSQGHPDSFFAGAVPEEAAGHQTGDGEPPSTPDTTHTHQVRGPGRREHLGSVPSGPGEDRMGPAPSAPLSLCYCLGLAGREHSRCSDIDRPTAVS